MRGSVRRFSRKVFFTSIAPGCADVISRFCACWRAERERERKREREREGGREGREEEREGGEGERKEGKRERESLGRG
eukprot:2216538-Rhodomonas_salina.1